ncbi:MAG TPA: hypothetical protein VHF58_05505 [Solirubrobacterales bacterium]|nr:hypothetical protein [Solirubrobacterales bacterium]
MSAATARTARLRATASVAVIALLSLLVVSTKAEAAPRAFFGVMPQDPLTTADYQHMGQAKVGTLRFMIHWASVDPGPGFDYNFAPVDEVVRESARNGVRPLPFITGTPAWVAKLDGENCSPCDFFAPRRAQALAAFRAFTADLARRYGPNGSFWAANPSVPEKPIRDWQIWNEQNSASFYDPKPNVKAYAKLINAAHDGITAVDPKADIVLGGMFGTPQQGRKPSIFAWRFLEKLYGIKGARKNFDGVGIHPYAGQMTKVIQQTELMIEAIDDARDRNVQTWFTELGWASSGPSNPLVKGSRGQAKRLKEAFKYFLRNRREFNAQTVIWYSWRDNNSGEGLCEWCAGSGLLTDNGGEKPAYRAFTNFTGGN